MTPDMEKAPDAYRTISEVAEDLDLPQHVLRFWETRFSHIRPLKRGGGRRYYRPDDVALIKGIRALLYGQGYTIKGVQRILKDKGVKHVQSLAVGAAPAPPAPALAEPVASRAEPSLAPPPPVVALPPVPTTDDAPAIAPPRAPSVGPVGESRRLLEAALAELVACRRLIEAARDAG